jgi:hypothetical protein
MKYGGADQTESEIRELDRNEPDAALFEIPQDYKVFNADSVPHPK